MSAVLDQFRLDGQVAVVTGATGKLGPTWCRALLEAGAKVAALDLAQANASEDFKQLASQYGEDQLLRIDGNVTDQEQLAQARATIEKSLGHVGILVNNAGIDSPPGQVTTYKVDNFPLEQFRNVLSVNTIGAFACMQVFGAGMAERGQGSIINIGSLYASVSPDVKMYDHLPTDPPFLKPPAYGASKAALHNLTKYVATHWGPYGVRTNLLSPGGVLGGQDEQFKAKFSSRTPLGRLCNTDELTGALLFLASAASCYVTGIELKVDGGFTAW